MIPDELELMHRRRRKRKPCPGGRGRVKSGPRKGRCPLKHRRRK